MHHLPDKITLQNLYLVNLFLLMIWSRGLAGNQQANSDISKQADD